MKFTTARCEVCNEYSFSPKDVIAYTVRNKTPEPVRLDGEQPWSGVRCICKNCCRFAAALIGEVWP